MKQRGRTVNKTARYTEADVKKIVNLSLEKSMQRMARSIHEIHEMAFKDWVLGNVPSAGIVDAMVTYNDLVVKYTNDLNNKEFTNADVRRYNRDPETDSQSD